MAIPNRIRVLITDDHTVVRSGLATFLQIFDDLELVGEAASGKEALALCASAHPDVVLMDLVMPGMDGTSATQAIRQQFPSTQVIALSSFWNDELVQSVLHAGAIGYLLKYVSADELAAAVRAAHAGLPTLAPEVAKTLIHARADGPALGHDLTPREREVLALMVSGLRNTMIAEQLVVSHSTVKFYVSSILAKLGVDSRVQAVALALLHHLVAEPPAVLDK